MDLNPEEVQTLEANSDYVPFSLPSFMKQIIIHKSSVKMSR